MRAIAATVAIGTADKDVAEELHLDLLEARAAAAFALPLAGVETEGAGIESALLRQVGLGEDGPDVIERANIDGGIRARGLSKDGLIHEDNAAEVFGTVKKWRVASGEWRVSGFGFAIAFGDEAVGGFNGGSIGFEPVH